MRVWFWLAENKDQLGVLLTAAAVGVAAWYAGLTHRLAKSAQAQADVTQRMFEAAYRPYLSIGFVPDPSFFKKSPDEFNFQFDLRAYGTVPVKVVTWRLELRDQDNNVLYRPSPPSGWDWWVYPQAPAHRAIVSQESQPFHDGTNETVLVEVTATYKASHERVYTIHMRIHGKSPNWRIVEYKAD
jgi:hypothetical protein